MIECVQCLTCLQIVETFDYASNETMIMCQLSESSTSPTITVVYFWYLVSMTVLLPYPILIIVAILMVEAQRRWGRASRTHPAKHQRLETYHSATGGGVLLRMFAEETRSVRILLIVIVLYLIMTSPMTLLFLLNGVIPHWVTWQDEQAFTAMVYPIFELIFYMYFATFFPLFCRCSEQFRRSLAQITCMTSSYVTGHQVACVTSSCFTRHRTNGPSNFELRSIETCQLP